MKQEGTVYLDNAATTYPKTEQVYKAMEEAGRNIAVNAGRGSYGLARKALAVIEETRERLKKLAGASEASEVIFTPSATLACNQVLGGLDWKTEDVAYVTPYEHNAVMRVLHQLQKRWGFQIKELPLITNTLQMDLEKIKFLFLKDPPSVLVMSHVSNVTGGIIPWEEICQAAKPYHPVAVIDGSQALGLVPVKLKNTAADFYIFAGHKTLYGPLGIGGYINNSGKKLRPVIAGGTGSDSLNLEMDLDSPAGYEPGSPNVVAAAGLCTALGELLEHQTEEVVMLKRERKLSGYLLEKLKQIPGIRLYQKQDQHRTGIVIFNLEGYRASDIGMILDKDYHIAVRTGYHCAPLIHKYLRDEDYGGVVRVSVGRFTTVKELDRLIGAMEEIALE